MGISEAAPLEWQRGKSLCNGVELAWEQTGPAHAPALLLIMGLGCQLVHWPESFCAEMLKRGFRVIRFDNRDIGLSGEAKRGVTIDLTRDWLRAKFGKRIVANYTLHDMAADTAALMDALQLGKAHLVGVSMGGMIAQLVSGLYPQRVASLTSIMSTTNEKHLPGPKPRVLFHMSGIGVKDFSREAVIGRNIKLFNMIGSPAYPTTPERRAEISGGAYDRAFRPGGLLRQTHAILATGGFADVSRQIKAPTQIIHGSSDPLVQAACGRRCSEVIPNAKFTLIEGMGHDFPDALMPRWAELIATNAGRA